MPNGEAPPCPCGCGCSEDLRGIELLYGECILCYNGDHWTAEDDEPAFDWPAIFESVREPTA